MLYFLKALDSRISNMTFPYVMKIMNVMNTRIQSAQMTHFCYIFEMQGVRRNQIWHSVCHEGHEGHGTWHIIKHNVGASRVSLDHFYLCSVQATFWIQSNNLYDLIKFIFDLMYLIWLQANERLWTFGRFPRVVIQQLEGV